MEALRQIEAWPAARTAAGVASTGGILAAHGDTEHRFGWGSVTKLLVAYATLIAVEEGATLVRLGTILFGARAA